VQLGRLLKPLWSVLTASGLVSGLLLWSLAHASPNILASIEEPFRTPTNDRIQRITVRNTGSRAAENLRVQIWYTLSDRFIDYRIFTSRQKHGEQRTQDFLAFTLDDLPPGDRIVVIFEVPVGEIEARHVLITHKDGTVRQKLIESVHMTD
jgi:hypothetical protein